MAAGDVRILNQSAQGKDSIVCDGTGDYVQIDAWGVAREAAGTADTVGTFAAWVNIKVLADSYSILSAGDTNATEYINFQIVNGLLNITLADGGAVAFDIEADAIGITINKWHHVAMVQNGVQPLLYIDGAVIAATNDTSTDITKWFANLNGIDNANIGILDQNTSTTLDMNGAIGEVKHWNRALTAAEIKKDFKNQTQEADVTADLISHWDWDGDLVDNVSAHNGTIVNNVFLDGNFSELTAEIQRVRALGGATDLIETIPIGDGKFNVIYVENT